MITGEGRLEALLVHHRRQALDLGAGARRRGLGLVEVADRRDPARAQLLGAGELGLREVELGLGGGEVGALDQVVDLDEVLAGGDLVVGLEEDVLDDARGLDRELDAAVRVRGADRLEARAPGDGLDLDRRHRDRRRLHRGEVAFDHAWRGTC